MQEEFSERLRAGHAGADSMRSNAEHMLREELEGARREGPHRMSMSSKGNEKLRYFKKGGRVSMEKEGGKLHRHKMPKTQTDLVLPRRAKTPKLNIENFEKASDMKRGGKAKKKNCYAAGGSVYEREMVGMHPSNKMPHFNYEAQMKGEHAVSKKFKSGGTVQKMAIGGSGKIRHKEATKAGMPIKTRRKMGC